MKSNVSVIQQLIKFVCNNRGKISLLVIAIQLIVTIHLFNESGYLRLTNWSAYKETGYEIKKPRVYNDWSNIKVEQNNENLHDKWIVFTTINPPTEDVKKLAKIPGWKVVVVGDTKSPEIWR